MHDTSCNKKPNLPLREWPRSADIAGGNWRLAKRLPFVLFNIFLGLLITPFMRIDELAGKRYRHLSVRCTSWWLRRQLKAMAVDVEIIGTPPLGASLIVANHVSWIDPFLVGGHLQAGFLVKQEAARWPVIGSLLRGAGCRFIPRGGNQTQRVICELGEAVGSGENMLMFPEATTTWGDGVSYFFPRLFAVAQNTQQPIQPVAIRYLPTAGARTMAPYTDDMQFGWHILDLLRAPSTPVQLEFLQPVFPANMGRDTLASLSRKVIADALAIPASSNQRSDIDFPGLWVMLRRYSGAWAAGKLQKKTADKGGSS